MSEIAQGELRAALEHERTELNAQLTELGHGPDGLTYDANFADTSQVTAERGEAEALANKLKGTLEDVENALTKLDAGTYGTCETCGKEIAPGRLEAMPTARQCIDCASKR